MRTGSAVIAAALALSVVGVATSAPASAAGAGHGRPGPHIGVAGLRGFGAAERASLREGETLGPAQSLRSKQGHFVLTMQLGGNLVERSADGTMQWSSGTSRPGAAAGLRPGGGFVVVSHAGRVLWSAGSGGHVGHGSRLTVRSNGALAVVAASGALLWSNHLGSRCSAKQPGQSIVVSISLQHLWACHGAHLFRTTPVTTGAVSRGWITPTGHWRVLSKARNVNLIGPSWDDHVKFWMDYNGPFGLHDAAWQKFPEGSPKYRDKGSHGCVHLPLTAMRAVFRWARIGAQVSIRG